mmetsp:Transcript_57747/g.137455  ORF Transcript_57747/g.137455 Transcript_57747/m.137455 type:complete len:535 (-) Transcript_57747:113-1717(-)
MAPMPTSRSAARLPVWVLLQMLVLPCQCVDHHFSTKWRIVNLGPAPPSGYWHVQSLQFFSTWWYDVDASRAWCHSPQPASGDFSQIKAIASSAVDQDLHAAGAAFRNVVGNGAGWTSLNYTGSSGAWLGIEFPDEAEVKCIRLFQGDDKDSHAEHIELQALRRGTGLNGIPEQWDSVSQWGGVDSGVLKPWTWLTLPEGHAASAQYSEYEHFDNSEDATCTWPWLDHATGLQFSDPDALDVICSSAATAQHGRSCTVNIPACNTHGHLQCIDGAIKAYIRVHEGDSWMRECVLQEIQLTHSGGSPITGALQVVEPEVATSVEEDSSLPPVLLALIVVLAVCSAGAACLCAVLLHLRLKKRRTDKFPKQYEGIGNSGAAKQNTFTLNSYSMAQHRQPTPSATPAEQLPEPAFDTEVSLSRDSHQRASGVKPLKIGSPMDHRIDEPADSNDEVSVASTPSQGVPLPPLSRGGTVAASAAPATPSKMAPNRALVYKNIEDALDASRRKKQQQATSAADASESTPKEGSRENQHAEEP